MSQAESVLRRIAAQGGGLIEICVLDTSYGDWDSAIREAVEHGYSTSLLEHGSEIPVLLTPEMFTEGDEMPYVLRVEIARKIWTTGLYSSSMIDFQGDPSDVVDVSGLDEICRFMKVISAATGKRSILIPEAIQVSKVKPYLEIYPDDSSVIVRR